jgi:hypothetical protein
MFFVVHSDNPCSSALLALVTFGCYFATERLYAGLLARWHLVFCCDLKEPIAQ